MSWTMGWLSADGLRLAVAAAGRLIGGPRSGIGLFLFQQPPPPKEPIIVKVITPPHDPTGISDVIIGAIGLTGAIVLLAIIFGLVFAGLLFWARSRKPLSH